MTRPARVRALALEEITTALRADARLSALGTQITGITHDSRQVQPGDLYAALPGAQAHGAAFSEQALARGAAAILTDRLGAGIAARIDLPVLVVEDPRALLGLAASVVYGHPSTKLDVFGVTGTNGKTTTAYLLDAGLRGCGIVTGVIGTIETRIAGEPVVSTRTTPEATDLQALLAVMVERGVSAVAMEVSSHALRLGRVNGTHFRAGLFTNLSQDHLDFHLTMEDYFASKASLFDAGRCELAVIDIADAWGRRLVGQLGTQPAAPPVVTLDEVATPGGELAGGAELAGNAGGAGNTASPDWLLQAGRGGFTVTGPDAQVTSVRLQMLGSFNAHNAGLAVATLISCGHDPERVAAGIGALAGVPGRMERVDSRSVGPDASTHEGSTHEGSTHDASRDDSEHLDDIIALVDYAHTPDAVVTLLRAVREFTVGKVIVVLGCGGDRDRGKRPLMGAALARHADIAVLTDDNPRSEPSAEILTAMAAGADQVPEAARAKLATQPDRAAAIALAVRLAQPGDTVVVAGKGHETGQDIRGTIAPFDDRVVLRAALGVRRAGRFA